MELHAIQPTHPKKASKRVGRGGKRGTYSGRGMKGQKARAGARFQPIVRESVKRYGKLRGYRAKVRRGPVAEVNVGTLQTMMEEGAVTPAALAERGVVGTIRGKAPEVKILGTGEVQKKFSVSGCGVSGQAREKIMKAGGTVEE